MQLGKAHITYKRKLRRKRSFTLGVKKASLVKMKDEASIFMAKMYPRHEVIDITVRREV